MKNIFLTCCLLVCSFHSVAGLIVTSDADNYAIGDTININLSLENNAAISTMLDMNFDAYTSFTFSENKGTFDSKSLPAQYTADVDAFTDVTFDGFFNEWLYGLSTYGTQAPFSPTDTILDLGTLSFVATEEGVFDFNMSSFFISDIPGYFEDAYDIQHSVQIVAKNVPAPAALSLMLIGLAGVFVRKKSN